ncbi:hypothetical protein [Pararhodobacter sp.]|uniref:hypothetical protein n=1 Tax=Pararhodobacter sp. TaxID=2127056 RepID=UPI002AFF4F5D|nr:hypothetical protein [Pararhodobacter sp.]
MSLLEGGKLAFGIVVGVSTSALILTLWPSCADGASSLWMCNEEPEIVLGVLVFIQGVVGAIAWPVAIVFLGFAFRNVISNLLVGLRLDHFRAGGMQLGFSSAVKSASESISQFSHDHPGELDSSGDPDAPLNSEQMERIVSNRRFAVVMAWIEIEEMLREIASSRGISGGWSSNLKRFSRSSINQFELPPEIASAISDLRRARNEIAHTSSLQISDGEIVHYLEIASKIKNYLQSLI